MSNQPEPTPITDNEAPDAWLLVIEDMKERRQIGIEKYGTPLHPNNGRNSAVDLFQEILDASVYAKNLILQMEALQRENKELKRKVLALEMEVLRQFKLMK